MVKLQDGANGCKCPFKTLKRNLQHNNFKICMSIIVSEYHNTYEIQLYFQIPPVDTASSRTSFTLQELRPNTAYQIRLCCAIHSSKYWSEWNEVIGFTAEDSKQCLFVCLPGLTMSKHEIVTCLHKLPCNLKRA